MSSFEPNREEPLTLRAVFSVREEASMISITAQDDVFGDRATLESARGTIIYYQLETLTRRGVAGLDRLPMTIKILVENALRYAGGEHVNKDIVLSLAHWDPGRGSQTDVEYPFMPSRVLLQYFTGVPAVADLAAMRSAVARMGGNPQKINP